MQILYSKLDKSVNFVEQNLIGFIESRYVRRKYDYFIAYLSSQTGCNRGCRMCHLTATRQTQFINCDQSDFISQLENVFLHYDNADEPKANVVHFNFMARGEPLANPTITETSSELFFKLGNMAKDKGLASKINISTIMPITFKKSLIEAFPFIHPTIYYSMYSVNEKFREKWLPAAMPVNQALEALKEYQKVSKKIIKFHCAFIDQENDSANDVYRMMEAIQKNKIVGEFNIVRYNPFSSEQGIESEKLTGIQQIISQYMPCKIITRVGEDCYSSCGQFVES